MENNRERALGIESVRIVDDKYENLETAVNLLDALIIEWRKDGKLGKTHSDLYKRAKEELLDTEMQLLDRVIDDFRYKGADNNFCYTLKFKGEADENDGDYNYDSCTIRCNSKVEADFLIACAGCYAAEIDEKCEDTTYECRYLDPTNLSQGFIEDNASLEVEIPYTETVWRKILISNDEDLSEHNSDLVHLLFPDIEYLNKNHIHDDFYNTFDLSICGEWYTHDVWIGVEEKTIYKPGKPNSKIIVDGDDDYLSDTMELNKECKKLYEDNKEEFFRLWNENRLPLDNAKSGYVLVKTTLKDGFSAVKIVSEAEIEKYKAKKDFEIISLNRASYMELKDKL